VNSREQIPKHHLAEIAAQLGTPRDLEYAIKLKECEDFADSLRKRLRELARVGRCNPEVLESGTFDLLSRKTGEEKAADNDELASLLLYNMTHASFVFRLWCQAATFRDFDRILTPESMRLHVRYPANHFLGLALDLETAGGLMPEFRDQCLAHLRQLATIKGSGSTNELSRRDHAIHILARYGRPADEALVADIIQDAATSDEPFSVRLGYAGLMLRSGNEELVDKYVWLLQHDDRLAVADLSFDAVHYGDATLGQDQQMPVEVEHFDKSIANILRRLEHPEQYAAIAELDVRRFLNLLDRADPNAFRATHLALSLRHRLEEILADSSAIHGAQVAAKLKSVLDRINYQMTSRP
jgi:hypothetical protein